MRSRRFVRHPAGGGFCHFGSGCALRIKRAYRPRIGQRDSPLLLALLFTAATQARLACWCFFRPPSAPQLAQPLPLPLDQSASSPITNLSTAFPTTHSMARPSAVRASLALLLLAAFAATCVSAGQFDGWSTGRATHVSGVAASLALGQPQAAAVPQRPLRTNCCCLEKLWPSLLSCPLQYDSIHEGSCMFGSLDPNKGTGYDIAAISDKVREQWAGSAASSSSGSSSSGQPQHADPAHYTPQPLGALLSGWTPDPVHPAACASSPLLPCGRPPTMLAPAAAATRSPAALTAP
jgi:hypothetical protein